MSNISAGAIDFAVLEQELNASLARACEAITSDPDRVAEYDALFDRSTESGFYGSDSPVKGRGEQPTWQPNPAYMRSLEAIWQGEESGSAERMLKDQGLVLERSLYELFFDSREYEDTEHEHRRVFSGHIQRADDGRPVTFFMLTVPHSHLRFELTQAPVIAISRALR